MLTATHSLNANVSGSGTILSLRQPPATHDDGQRERHDHGWMTTRAAPTIPASHARLVDAPPIAALTTLMPNGSPHTTPVWCNLDGVQVLVNTMRGLVKERNMRRDPRATLLCYDPQAPLRTMEIRGRVVEMTEQGAREHLHTLALSYTGKSFRDLVPGSARRERRCP